MDGLHMKVEAEVVEQTKVTQQMRLYFDRGGTQLLLGIWGTTPAI